MIDDERHADGKVPQRMSLEVHELNSTRDVLHLSGEHVIRSRRR